MMSVVRYYWVSRLADCVKPWASGQVWPFAPFSKFWASACYQSAILFMVSSTGRLGFGVGFRAFLGFMGELIKHP